MSELFSPLQLRGVTVKNRLVLAPRRQDSASDGIASDYHLVHFGRFALGGFGIVMIEATAVTPEGRISHGDLGLWADRQIEPLARIARFLREQGATPAITRHGTGRREIPARRPWRRGGGNRDRSGPGRARRLHRGPLLRQAPLPTRMAMPNHQRSMIPGSGISGRLLQMPHVGHSRPGSRSSTCIARTVICSISSSRRSRTGELMLLAVASRTGCACRS